MTCSFLKTTNVYVLWRRHILLIKRSSTDENLPNFWESPGGHVDLKVHLSDNFVARREAVREVQEETGLRLDIGLLKPYQVNHKTCHIAYVYDFRQRVPPAIKLSFEHSEFTWKSCKYIFPKTRKEVKEFIQKELCGT